MTSLCHAHGHMTDKGKTLNFSARYTIWLFNQQFDNLYSFLHPAKHGFPFILKNVLFKEINDIEIPITFLNKMKKPMLSYILYLRVNCLTLKNIYSI